jgi:hypothetical protein
VAVAALDAERQLLRHSVATVAYRGAKVLRGVPPVFAEMRLAPKSRSPLEIVAHMADLFTWAGHLADGRHVWEEPPRGTWDVETRRFFEQVTRFDARLASDEPIQCEPKRLFQGPIADALSHIGQLALLRRVAGAPIRGENYFQAVIAAGTVGPDQAEARVEFD